MASNTIASRVSVEDEVLDLERQYWQAIKDKDIDGAIRLSDNPSILTGAHGVMSIDPQTYRTMAASSNFTLHSFEFRGEPIVRKLTDDVVIVAYQVHEELTVDGISITLDAAESSTWVRRDGQWVCALHTESISGDPFGRKTK